MTKDEQDLAKIAVQTALSPFTDLITKLFGGLAEETGGMWQDAARVRRLKRQVKLFAEVQRIIADAGFDPRQVPDNISIPLLSAASLQDDETLQAIWARMLSNAADPRNLSEVEPSFPAILSDLSARDVRFLDALYSVAEMEGRRRNPENTRVDGWQVSDTGLKMIYTKVLLPERPYDLGGITHGDVSHHRAQIAEDLRQMEFTLALLAKHNVLVDRSSPEPISLGDTMDSYAGTVKIAMTTTYTFTELGSCFMRACRPPEKASEAAES